MTDLLQGLRERKLGQWALTYLAGAWVLLQGLDLIGHQFGWPGGLLRGITVLLGVSFFATLVLAWYHGERGVQKVSGTELLILALLLAIGGALLWRFARTAQESAPAAKTTTQIAKLAIIPAKSIAVLPFTDLSPGHDQEYFSDGMAEEILNALAQVKDLKVAGRTSSFYFRSRNEDMRTIGKTLGVANILEGSVRKQGDKVRITAQLIQASDGFHLWSNSYDGDLKDVFELQERIARAITDKLKVVLEGEKKIRLVQAGTTNTEAYGLYLQATEALNQRDYPRMGDAIGWLEQAIKLDPNFAPAHARLAMIHVLGWAQYGASDTEAERQAGLALALDPKLAETQYALAFLARHQRRFVDARIAIDRAFELAPDDASVNFYDAQLLINTGYTQRGIQRLDRTLAIDPLLPNALHWRATQYLFAGDTDAAERMWKRAGEVGLSYADVGLSQVAEARGDFAKARSLRLPNLLANTNDTACLENPAASLPVYFDGVYGGDATARAKALVVLDECLAAVSNSESGKPETVPLWALRGLLRFDQAERALQVIARGQTSDDAGLFIYFWSPQGRNLRHLAALPAFARKVGFAALWDNYGAPDLCRKNAAGDYICE